MISPWMGDRNTLQNWWQRSDSEVWCPASRAQGLRTGLDDSGGRRVLVRMGLSGDNSGCRRVKRG